MSDLGDAVGMPDNEDFEWISARIRDFEERYPGELKRIQAETIRQRQENKNNDFNIVSKESARRQVMSLPYELYIPFKKAYPTIFGKHRSKKHVAWFLRKFPVFKIGKF